MFLTLESATSGSARYASVSRVAAFALMAASRPSFTAVPGLTGQRRLARAVEDDVVRFRLPALLPFDFEFQGATGSENT